VPIPHSALTFWRCVTNQLSTHCQLAQVIATMQLCVGSIRSKNAMNILLKNIIDGCIGAVSFYFIGYGFAYGTNKDGSGNGFIGSGNFLLSEIAADGTWVMWFFQWTFAAAAATIVSGSVAERCTFEAYMGYSALVTAIVYPIAVHWCAV
jgi:ammonium transporter, Amt family